MSFLSKITIGFLFLGLSLNAKAQSVQFEAWSDSKTVVLGNTFEVSFTLTNAEARKFQAPEFDNFIKLSGPNKGQSIQIINGSTKKTTSYSFRLKPEKIGTYKIKAARAVVGNKTYFTEEITVKVIKQENSNATTEEDLETLIKKGIFLKAVPIRDSVIIGEQILIDFMLYTQYELNSKHLIVQPEFTEAYAKVIRNKDVRPFKEVIEGKTFQVQRVLRIAVFPQKTGALDVGMAGVRVGILTENEANQDPPNSIFDLFSNRNVRQHEVYSDPISLLVSDVPSPTPKGFSGAVGNYSMRVLHGTTSITTDDALSIRLEVKGNGDPKRIKAPKLNLPKDFDVLDPQTNSSEIERNGEIVSTKTFEYLIIPSKEGNFRVSPELQFYNPDSLGFFKTNPKTIVVSVSPGEKDPVEEMLIENENANKNKLEDIVKKTRFHRPGNSFFASPAYWGILGLSLLAYFGILYRKAQIIKLANLDPSVVKMQKAQKVSQLKLKKAERLMSSGNSKAFYEEISLTIWGYLSDKFNIPASEFSKPLMQRILTENGISPEISKEGLAIVQKCEMALFASLDPGEMQTTYDDTTAFIDAVEKQSANS